MEKRQKRTAKIGVAISIGCAVLSLTVLLTSVTYSWIRRNWMTRIYDDNIKIETNGSLAFILEGSTSAMNSISIPEVLQMQNFTLKPVSNATGESYDFFTLDRNSGDKYLHLVPSGQFTASNWMNVGKAYGYIEFHLTMMGENTVSKEGEQGTGEGTETANYTKYVYLNPDSHFNVSGEFGSIDPSYALRISISTSTNTFIFMRSREGLAGVAEGDGLMHSGVTSVRGTGEVDDPKTKWYADGQDYWSKLTPGTPAYQFSYEVREGVQYTYDTFEKNQAHELSEYDGGITERDGARYIDKSKCLCSFPGNKKENIVVRVWIEGSDENYCNDAIAGLNIELLLSFEAVNCELDGKIIERIVKETSDQSDETTIPATDPVN